MPVVRVKPGNKYHNMFITGGPRPRDRSIKEDLMKIAVDCYSNKIRDIKIAEEISKDGYYHFHIMLDLNSPQRYTNVIKKLKSFLDSIDKHSDETRNVNVGVYYCTDRTNAKSILTKYLSNPTKDKDVDDGILEYDPKSHTSTTKPEGMSQGDWVFLEHYATKYPKKPVFHRMSCKCELCV